MPNYSTRLLFVVAYAVILLEGAIPVFERHGHVDNPIWQTVVLAFAAINMLAFVILRPRPLLLTLAVFNGIIGATTIIGGSVALVRYGLTPMTRLDVLVVIGFFAGAMPLIAATFLYSSASRLTYVRADAP